MLYVVTLIDTLDKVERVATCKTNAELANLLLHLDEHYQVVNIMQIPDYVENYTELLKKDDNLEVGQ